MFVQKKRHCRQCILLQRAVFSFIFLKQNTFGLYVWLWSSLEFCGGHWSETNKVLYVLNIKIQIWMKVKLLNKLELRHRYYTLICWNKILIFEDPKVWTSIKWLNIKNVGVCSNTNNLIVSSTRYVLSKVGMKLPNFATDGT